VNLPDRRRVYTLSLAGWLWCLVLGYRRRDGVDCWGLTLTRTPRRVTEDS
jgi:hypothetical protein